MVGVPRIELGSHTPEARILPLYYTPMISNRINADTDIIPHFFRAAGNLSLQEQCRFRVSHHPEYRTRCDRLNLFDSRLNSAQALFSTLTSFRFAPFLSGCRESNPAYIHPMDAYCRYTTARLSEKAQALEHL